MYQILNWRHRVNQYVRLHADGSHFYHWNVKKKMPTSVLGHNYVYTKKITPKWLLWPSINVKNVGVNEMAALNTLSENEADSQSWYSELNTHHSYDKIFYPQGALPFRRWHIFLSLFLASPSYQRPHIFSNFTQRPYIFSQNCVLSPRTLIFQKKINFESKWRTIFKKKL